MPIYSEWTIDYTTKRIYHSSGTTVYSVRNLYTWVMDQIDSSTTIDDSVPMTAQTPQEFTLTNGWFIDDDSMQYLRGGAIQTSGWTHPTNITGIRILTLDAVSGLTSDDIGTVVQGGTTGDTGTLLAYNTTDKKLWVRSDAVDDLFDDTDEAITVDTISCGNMTAASVSGENMWSNIYTLGTIISGTTMDVYQEDTQLTPWWSSGHIDVLVKVKEAGTEIDSGNLTVLARKYSTLYDHYTIDASSGRNPVPLATFTDNNNQTAEGTVGAAPYTSITFSFGAKSRDLNNGNGARPYDVEIDCADLTIAQVYEYLKYVTRTGSSTTLNGVNGEYYTGVGDIRLDYTGESGGPFVETSAITSDSGGSGYIVSLIDNGATGTLVIRNVHGTFADTDTITSGSTTATISGTPDTLSPSKQAPFGTFAGGQFFGARGVWITNVNDVNSNNYQLIDSTNTTQTPPSTVAIRVESLAIGDRVAVFRTSSGSAVNKAVFISGVNNNSGDTTFDVTDAIPSDTPSTGSIRIVDIDNNTNRETRYSYSSWSSTTFTLTSGLDRSYAANTDTAYVPFIDTQATSTVASVSITYVTDRSIVVSVRKYGGAGSSIVPFTITGTVGSAGYSTSAIRTADSIVS